ncbi:MAG: hypothetical protein WCD20_03615 [Rhodomicrobium sp.]
MPLRRHGIVKGDSIRDDPGSAVHRFTLHRVWDDGCGSIQPEPV